MQGAMKAGFQFFNQFFSKEQTRRALLEELEFDESDSEWSVTIGFDTGRETISEPNIGSFFGEKKREPVREYRTFRVRGDDGSFVKMSSH